MIPTHEETEKITFEINKANSLKAAVKKIAKRNHTTKEILASLGIRSE